MNASESMNGVVDTLLEYWRVLSRYRWMVVGLITISVLTRWIYGQVIIVPPSYAASVRILSPQLAKGGATEITVELPIPNLRGSGGDPSLPGGNLSPANDEVPEDDASGHGRRTPTPDERSSSDDPLTSVGSLVSGTGVDLSPPVEPTLGAFLAILKSRAMAERLAKQFNLRAYYAASSDLEAIRGVQGSTDVSVSLEGAITVTVSDREPKMAADIAGAYVRNLNLLYGRIGVLHAARQREFISAQLKDAENALRRKEEMLRRFKERYGIVGFTAQAGTAMAQASKLKERMAATQARLEVVRSYATEQHPEVVALKEYLDTLARQLAEIQYGRGTDLSSEGLSAGPSRKEYHLPWTRLPEVGKTLSRLIREMRMQERTVALLRGNLEQAQMAEALESPVAQVLDEVAPAQPALRVPLFERIMMTAGLGLVVGTFLAFFLEYLAPPGVNGRTESREA